MARVGERNLVKVRFRPLSEREYRKGGEIVLCPDGDKIVRNEYNVATAFAFEHCHVGSSNDTSLSKLSKTSNSYHFCHDHRKLDFLALCWQSGRHSKGATKV